MRREMPLWVAVVVILLVILMIAGFFVWRSRAKAPGGGPPVPAAGEPAGY